MKWLVINIWYINIEGFLFVPLPRPPLTLSTFSPSSLTSGVVRCSAGHPSELRLFPGKLKLDHPVSLWESVLCFWLVLAHHTPSGVSALYWTPYTKKLQCVISIIFFADEAFGQSRLWFRLNFVVFDAAYGPELSKEQRRFDPNRPDTDPHRQPRRHAGRILQQPGSV